MVYNGMVLFVGLMLLSLLLLEARRLWGGGKWRRCAYACMQVYVRQRSEIILNTLPLAYSSSNYFCFHERSDLKLVKAEKSKYEVMVLRVNTGTVFLMSMF